MKTFKPSKVDVNAMLQNSMKIYNAASPAEKKRLIGVVEDGVKRYKGALKDVDYDAPFPTGDARKEMKVKLEAGKLFLKRIIKP